MTIILSTNTYIKSGLNPIFELLNNNPELGIELFANNQDDEYTKNLLKIGKKTDRFLTYHEQIFDVDHSELSDDESYSLQQIKIALKHCKELGIKDIVYHVNNKTISNKNNMITNASKELKKITQLADKENINILVENVGVISKNNMLLNESEFIDFCLAHPNPVLIDIGHVNANGWNLKHVIKSLNDKIKFYHLHNNDGYNDEHLFVHDGTLDIEYFFELYFKYTPNAKLTLEYNYDIGLNSEGIQRDIDYVYEKINSNIE
ncbi:sugar phosphate isomerase/epimerase [Staphylococcus hominis]|uniref:sugar phosphate isomerase/epimerase family protein n=1 Tax=Staphylococcus hominis TaxID=1290 RepID=UPI001F587BEF|nr:sugar phosphate isomerase/epimerase [Staphylococcus hominis]MCI2899045.1 sugar phosphate isomerase/epimerase [Staphylococcus hominis]